jgi:dolichol-phosphate mannosyltransferase
MDELRAGESADRLTERLWQAPRLTIIIPTFNERGNIELLYDHLSQVLADIPWEMIVVDDNSPDGTADAVRAMARRFPNVRCLKRIGRRGLSSACVEGMSATAAPFLAVMDADHQHDERILPQMLARAEQGADLVVGTRFAAEGSADEGLSAVRLRGSRLATQLSALVTGQHISDPMSGYFLLRRDVFEKVAPELSSEGFKILLDLVVTANRRGKKLSIAEVPYTFRQRLAGESKMSPLVVIQFLGLWLSKLTGGLLPTSFLLFAMVGATGVFVHLLSLWLLYNVLGVPFVGSQIGATLIAMTSNFFLNNELTYSDKRLRGMKLATGLLGFYLVCSIGGIANVSVASMIYETRQTPFIAGLAGAVMSSVFNYAVTRIFTWR